MCGAPVDQPRCAGHSITNLLRECEQIDSSFSRPRSAKELDQYYLPTRYPEGLPDQIPHEYYQEDASIGIVLRLCEFDIPVEPLVYTPAELERMIEQGNDFVLTALREGKVVYER